MRGVFAQGYRRQGFVLAGFSVAVLESCFVMWERVPRRHEVIEKEVAGEGTSKGT